MESTTSRAARRWTRNRIEAQRHRDRRGPRPSLYIGVAAAALILVGAASAATTRTAAKPVLTIGAGSAPASLDPAKDGGNFYFQELMNEPLLLSRADGSLGPGLATSWGYVKEKAGSGLANKVFRFTLRHNARFSDGTPVTAQAVKTWILYYENNGNGATDLGPIASLKTVGKWTVILQLKSPNPTLAATFALSNLAFISSPACVANPSELSQTSCGAGPYKLVPSQSVAGDHYTAVPNPYYYDKTKVYWSKVVEKVIPTASSMLQAMQAGQIDANVVPDPSIAGAVAAAGLKVQTLQNAVTATFFLMASGDKSSPLGDLRVRQALNYAVDRNALAKVLGKDGHATDQIRLAEGFDPKLDKYYTYNPAKAKALLAAAGYPNGFEIGPVTYPAFDTQSAQITQAAAKYFSAVGVTLDLHPATTGGDFVQHLIVDPDPMFELGIGPRTTSQWTGYTTYLKPGSVLNNRHGGWSDPVINQLWVKASRAANPDPLWKQLNDRIITQAYFVPMAGSPFYLFTNPKKVTGALMTPQGYNSLLSWAPAK